MILLWLCSHYRLDSSKFLWSLVGFCITQRFHTKPITWWNSSAAWEAVAMERNFFLALWLTVLTKFISMNYPTECHFAEYFVSSTEKFLKWFSLSRGFFSPPTCLGCSLKTKWSRRIPYSLKVAPLNHRFKGFSAIASNFWARPSSDPVCTRTYTTQKCPTDACPPFVWWTQESPT